MKSAPGGGRAHTREPTGTGRCLPPNAGAAMKASLREWLRRTHGAFFELLRHFLTRFFDSDLITTPGQMAGPLIGVFSLLLPWFNMFIGMLREKYAHFGGLPTPEPFRHIVRPDDLWLVTLMMSALGLLTAARW